MTAQSDQARKILFFTAGREPTAEELDLIAQIPGQILIRNSKATPSQNPPDDIDGVAAAAGTTIPAPYDDAGDYPIVTPGGASTLPASLVLASGRANIDLSNGETEQLILHGVMPDTETIVDMHDNAKVTYVSSDPTKATVSTTGLVTPVAAGATNITATYTDDDENEKDSNTVAITVVA